MKIIFTLVVLFVVGLTPKVSACDCMPIPNFCESITFNNNGQILNYLSIYRIKVNAILTNGLNVSVRQTYFGDNLAGRQLFLEDGNGDCILIASNSLEDDTEYIVAASRSSSDTIFLSACFVSFLKVKNGMVTGAIKPGVNSVRLSEFPDLANCGNLTPTLIGGLVVRPTLVSNEVEISTTSLFKPEDLKLKVFDVAGRVVFQSNHPDFGSDSAAKVNMKDWSAGAYFLHLEIAGKKIAVKLMKAGAD